MTRDEMELLAVNYARKHGKINVLQGEIIDFAVEVYNQALDDAIGKVQYTGGNSEEINVGMISGLKID